MMFLASACLAAVLLTFGTAWLSISRHPARSGARHFALAAASFPALSTLVVVVLIVHTVLQRRVPADEGPLGMVIFAFLMFYGMAMMVGTIVGVPAALIAVKVLRR